MTSENAMTMDTDGVVRCPKCKERMIHLNYGHRRYGWYCLHCGTEIEVDTVEAKGIQVGRPRKLG